MRNAHGDFVWYELLTTEPEAAAAFYGAVLGWAVQPGGAVPGYRLFVAAGTEVAGVMALPPEAVQAGMPPQWLGYIGVDGVDEAVAGVLAAGGSQYVPPTDIPGIGRFALLADPQGVPFYVMRGTMDEASDAFAPMRPGHCNWNELTTTDREAALRFYGTQFGWEKGDAMPIGETEEYRFLQHHGVTLGAVMNRMPGASGPGWTFYFGVPDIDRAAGQVTTGGGTVQHGPAEVPGGSFIILGTDPQGARFGLVGPRAA